MQSHDYRNREENSVPNVLEESTYQPNLYHTQGNSQVWLHLVSHSLTWLGLLDCRIKELLEDRINHRIPFFVCTWVSTFSCLIEKLKDASLFVCSELNTIESVTSVISHR